MKLQFEALHLMLLPNILSKMFFIALETMMVSSLFAEQGLMFSFKTLIFLLGF